MCVGLEAKHKERDLDIPKHRQKLMTGIEQDLINDINVLAVFTEGQ
ncbi:MULTISPECIES: hypothetical protein [Metabacillus]|nr:hypothetical protein [Metabacillus sp. KUDC1714]